MIELLLFLIAGINFFLASLFLSKGFKNLTNLFFALFIFGAAIWPLSITLFMLSDSLAAAYFWDKVIYSSGTLVPVSFLLFSYLFTKKKFPSKLSSLIYLIIPLAFSLSLYTSELFIEKISISSLTKSVSLGPVYPLWMLYFSVYMAISTFWLFVEFRKSHGLIRLQLSYILLAVFFPLMGSFPFNILLPFFGNYRLIFIGPIFLTAMVVIITYAIFKHRLMDIRLVAARTVAYSLLVVIISAFYVSATFVVSSYLLGAAVALNQTLIYTGLTVLVALSFNRLKIFLEKLTDKIFFRGNYNANQLLSKLSIIMSTNIELEILCKEVLYALINQMKVSRGAFVILGEGVASVYDTIDIGFPAKLTISYDKISPFFPFAETIVFDELEENHLKALLRQSDLSVAKTLMVKNQVTGVLLLGEKSSGGVFSQQDLKVLEILAPGVAVAIQNSLSYDKIKQFNLILSTEVKKATSDLQEVNQRLKESDKIKDDFVSVVSHELRTPMTAIRSYAWMALHKSDISLSEKLERYLIRVLISTERLINLVNDMLNISRIESGRIEINPEPVDLIKLIKDIVDEVYYSKSTEKNIQFYILEKPVPKVLADPERLREVLLNLVGNSLKFTPGGGKIVFDFFSDGITVEVSVKDTGIGISKEDSGRLFQKFGRLDNSYIATASSGGTGLGLYISKSLILLMHGRIWAQSEGSGKGTTFTIALPVAV